MVFFPGASLRPAATEATVGPDAEAPALERGAGDPPGPGRPERDRPEPAPAADALQPGRLAELVHSVREFGVLQPVVVRKNTEGEYELIMGGAAHPRRS